PQHRAWRLHLHARGFRLRLCLQFAQRGVVAAQGSITFIRPGKLGDKLIATAREVSKTGRSGIYDVRVTSDDVVIAEFRGHSRTIGGRLVPATVGNDKNGPEETT